MVHLNSQYSSYTLSFRPYVFLPLASSGSSGAHIFQCGIPTPTETSLTSLYVRCAKRSPRSPGSHAHTYIMFTQGLLGSREVTIVSSATARHRRPRANSHLPLVGSQHRIRCCQRLKHGVIHVHARPIHRGNDVSARRWQRLSPGAPSLPAVPPSCPADRAHPPAHPE